MEPADKPVLESVLTCPHGGVEKQETMPQDACQFFYECTGCKTLLRPKPRHCCVFCSFGSVKCPPIREQRAAAKLLLIQCTALENWVPDASLQFKVYISADWQDQP